MHAVNISEDGFYWYRESGENWTIAQYTKSDEPFPFQIVASDDIYRAEGMTGVFVGPIPMPPEDQ